MYNQLNQSQMGKRVILLKKWSSDAVWNVFFPPSFLQVEAAKEDFLVLSPLSWWLVLQRGEAPIYLLLLTQWFLYHRYVGCICKQRK